MCLSSWECLGSDKVRVLEGSPAFLILYFWFFFFQWRSHTCKTQILRLVTQTGVFPCFLSGRCRSEFLVPQGSFRSIPTPEPGTAYLYPYLYPAHASRSVVCELWQLNPVSIFQEFYSYCTYNCTQISPFDISGHIFLCRNSLQSWGLMCMLMSRKQFKHFNGLFQNLVLVCNYCILVHPFYVFEFSRK